MRARQSQIEVPTRNSSQLHILQININVCYIFMGALPRTAWLKIKSAYVSILQSGDPTRWASKICWNVLTNKKMSAKRGFQSANEKRKTRSQYHRDNSSKSAHKSSVWGLQSFVLNKNRSHNISVGNILDQYNAQLPDPSKSHQVWTNEELAKVASLNWNLEDNLNPNQRAALIAESFPGKTKEQVQCTMKPIDMLE